MSEAMILSPEIGVPLEEGIAYLDLVERARAACNSALSLEKFGLDLTPSADDKATATQLALGYAENPDDTSQAVSNKRGAGLPPASLVLVSNILDEFGQKIVKEAVHIRHLVTNKLLLLSDSKDPRVKLRALDMLGKISDVGLFADKLQVEVTHKSSDELRDALKGKLKLLIQPNEPIEDAVIIEGEVVSDG